MLKLSALLFAVDSLVAVAMGIRYVGRRDFMPYQAKATGRSVADLDPALRVTVQALLRAVGGGFLAFGLAALGLSGLLWYGQRLAGVALAAGSVALLVPTYMAAASINRFRPDAAAPTKLVFVTAAILAAAVIAFGAGVLG